MKKSTFQCLFICLFFSLISCAQVNKKEISKKEYSNALIDESSPYLLQHAHNPVNWYPWGQEALDKAQKEDKILIISIGYAACHWCHVMEHESFEDSAVAKLMNDHFICIKVDREERPDIDQIYMNACQLITQSGGWPLNAFALPDGKPFHAGTYFSKSDWTKVLNYFIDLKQKDPQAIETAAQQVTDGISQMGRVGLNPKSSEYTMDKLDIAFQNWLPSIDFEEGGFGKAPKFPMPCSWDFLLQYAVINNNKQALAAVQVTLDKMALGGIYDQLGGGFSRYSVDASWKVPHFEKMLYDNGQLVSLYAQAYLQTKEPLYKKVVYETLDWIEREMTSSEGAFYASLDADSEGEEGKFYVWKTKEIKTILGEDAALFLEYYNCTNNGNWEQQNNILLRQKEDDKILKKFQVSASQLEQKITACNSKLMLVRKQRIRPALDDKILTSWNALMLTAYIKAYRTFGEEKFLKTALKNAAFLKSKAIGKDYKITRNYKDGKSTISGFLDDYAFLISAYIELYQVTFEEQWLQLAKELTDHCLEHFFDKTSGMFHFTPNYNADLISRQMEVSDNVIPASNSEMANNLFKLSLYYYNNEYLSISKQQLDNVRQKLELNPAYFSNWAKLYLNIINEPYSVAIVGKDAAAKRQELDQYYLPNILFMGGKNEGSLELLKGKNIPNQTTIFVCQNKACKRPVTTISEALELINN